MSITSRFRRRPGGFLFTGAAPSAMGADGTAGASACGGGTGRARGHRVALTTGPATGAGVGP